MFPRPLPLAVSCMKSTQAVVCQGHRVDGTVWLVLLSAAAAEQAGSCPAGRQGLQGLYKPTDLVRVNTVKTEQI